MVPRFPRTRHFDSYYIFSRKRGAVCFFVFIQTICYHSATATKSNQPIQPRSWVSHRKTRSTLHDRINLPRTVPLIVDSRSMIIIWHPPGDMGLHANTNGWWNDDDKNGHSPTALSLPVTMRYLTPPRAATFAAVRFKNLPISAGEAYQSAQEKPTNQPRRNLPISAGEAYQSAQDKPTNQRRRRRLTQNLSWRVVALYHTKWWRKRYADVFINNQHSTTTKPSWEGSRHPALENAY